jgi:hypothetical protein
MDHGASILIKKRQRPTLPGFNLVPSALAGLTSLFGMGRGGPRRQSHLKVFDMHVAEEKQAIEQGKQLN